MTQKVTFTRQTKSISVGKTKRRVNAIRTGKLITITRNRPSPKLFDGVQYGPGQVLVQLGFPTFFLGSGTGTGSGFWFGSYL